MAFEVKKQNGETEPVAVLSLGSDKIEFDTTQSLLPRIIMSIRIPDGVVLETLSKVLKARGKRHVVDWLHRVPPGGARRPAFRLQKVPVIAGRGLFWRRILETGFVQ